MNKKNSIFQCDICGNLIAIVKKGGGSLKCCGEKMFFLGAKTGNPASEKHIPILKNEDTSLLVTAGVHPHPMVKAHFLGFIEAESKDFIVRKELCSGYKPELRLEKNIKLSRLRSYCIIHGVHENILDE